MIEKTEMHQFVNPEATRVPDPKMARVIPLHTMRIASALVNLPPPPPPLEGNVGITKHKKYFHTKYTKFANWAPEMKDIQYNIASIQTEYNMIHLCKNKFLILLLSQTHISLENNAFGKKITIKYNIVIVIIVWIYIICNATRLTIICRSMRTRQQQYSPRFFVLMVLRPTSCNAPAPRINWHVRELNIWKRRFGLHWIPLNI